MTTNKVNAPKRALRLMQLMTILKVQPGITPSNLYDQLGIKKSQFSKDKQSLEDMGFTFRYDRSQKRYEITKEPFFPSAGLSFLELFSLISAIKQMSVKGDHALSAFSIEAIRKMIAATQDERTRELLRYELEDTTLKKGFGCHPDVLNCLFSATKERKRVKVLYKAPNDEPREFLFNPYVVFFRKRALYVDGYRPDPIEYKGFKTLRLNRIESITQLPYGFPQQGNYNFHERWEHVYYLFGTNTPPTTTRFRFSAKATPYIKEIQWHNSQSIQNERDGGCILTLHVAEPKEAVREFMEWGAEMEVLEPEELRMWYHEELQKMLALHT